jgi:hypothetical protein
MLSMTMATWLVGCNKVEDAQTTTQTATPADPISLHCVHLDDITAQSVTISSTDLATFTLVDGSKKIYDLRSEQCVITVAPGSDSAVHLP